MLLLVCDNSAAFLHIINSVIIVLWSYLCIFIYRRSEYPKRKPNYWQPQPLQYKICCMRYHLNVLMVFTQSRRFLFSFLFFIFFVGISSGQIVINEVSQGASGSKEYVELVVTGTPNCQGTPCVDLRGWYIDDNNGNHATGSGTGIAQGCIRFSNNSFWSCVPIGQIIVIYNDADINPMLPSNDISLTDGNCVLVIPISNCTLFERNTSQPSTALSLYPTNGFTACGNWTNIGMANTDDSFQTINPLGTLYHSVSWGNNVLSQIIYFSGSSTGSVAWNNNAVNTNPALQANWIRTGVAGNETPGTPNNLANAAWISSMNNNCIPFIPLSATITSTSALCNCTGTATVSPSGGTPTYTYLWAPSGGTAASATGLCAGTYTCTITDANACTQILSVIVSSIGTLTLSGSVANVSCNGGCNGSATTVVTIGTSPFTYLWSPSGGTNATASGLCPGTYTCTVTDAANCTGTQTFLVTQPAQLVATPTQTNLLCNGGNSGTATITTLGGTPSFTYSWAPTGGNFATAVGLAAGIYTCTITDANGCIVTQTVVITQPTAIVPSPSQINILCNGGSTGSASVNPSGGNPGYTFSWSPSGGNLATANNLTAGTYSCTITDLSGCVTIQPFSITQPSPIVANTLIVAATCGNPNGAATITVSGGSPGYSYLWSPSGGNTATATNLTAGNYSCTITDANGCTIIQPVIIANLFAPTVSLAAQTAVSCFGGANATAAVVVVGGTSPYTYLWAPSGGTGFTAIALAAGTYTCTVTDANGCIAIQTVTIIEPAALTSTMSTTPVSCFAGSNGTATVVVAGGTPGYSYAWAPTGGNAATATTLSNGTYSCTITDLNGCVIISTVVITQPSILSASSSTTNVLCNGGNTGSSIVSPSGGIPSYNYAWTPTGGNTSTANNLTAGNYSCTITDQNGCVFIENVLITEPTLLTVSVSSTPANCGFPDGSVTAIPSGGTANYTYAWSPGSYLTSTVNNIATGSYSVIVTDQNGCVANGVVSVINLNGVVAVISSQQNVTCYGQATGAIFITQSGGNPAYTYTWFPNISSADSAVALTAGNYSCTVTDASGCTSLVTIIITEPPPLILSATANPVAVCAGSPVLLAAIPGGGSPSYAVTWNPGNLIGASHTVFPTASGNYIASVVDINGCITNTPVNIIINPVPSAGFTVNNTVGCAPLCVQFIDTSTSAAAIVSWFWDFGDGNTSTQQNPSYCYPNSGNFTVQLSILTIDGCVAVINITSCVIVLPTAVAAFTVSPQPTTMLNPELFFTSTSSNATAWSWNFGDLFNTVSTLQNPSCTFTSPICYQVSLAVSNSFGCNDSIKQEVCLNPEETFFIPNSFSPNGDGKNDFFMPVGEGINEDGFEFLIFDRWGNLIFESHYLTIGWDGRVKNHPNIAQIDTYVWALKFTNINGFPYELAGIVNLIK